MSAIGTAAGPKYWYADAAQKYDPAPPNGNFPEKGRIPQNPHARVEAAGSDAPPRGVAKGSELPKPVRPGRVRLDRLTPDPYHPRSAGA
jgi:hypothetical protein